MKNKQNNTGALSGLSYDGGRVGVLLIHSLGGAPMELKYVAQELARSGYTVRCPILPGMSHGTDVLGLSSWRDWYEAAEAEFDRLKEECDIVLVGGLSAGSVISLRLAAERGDQVDGLLIFAPTLWPNGWAIPKSFNFFALVFQRWFARLFRFRQRAPFGIKDERLRNFMVEAARNDDRSIEDYYSRSGAMVLQFKSLVSNVKRMFGRVTQPTLIIHPREDDQSHLSNAMKIQARIKGPVETIILDDCYHMITLDKQRDIVLERTIDFTTRLVARIEKVRTPAAPRVVRQPVAVVSSVAAE